ncbi:hypothetical protein GRS48_14355 [Halorubrum sp. JWXQ-INN 858]|uniref:hypothetical protein n=1 Tax=Halorubrum sp. JWXQ-INN 858 TaxID=2690782 RepID=UPI00135B0304|nr:hypothetical protein [Halorubrum sp. JWXQ-INN 858]MWV65991.1 hypothetical protein [Halorubrum sp. JWXQ-INN 858]
MSDDRAADPVETARGDAPSVHLGSETVVGFLALSVPAVVLVALGVAGAATSDAGAPVAALVAAILVAAVTAVVAGAHAEWWTLRAALARASEDGVLRPSLVEAREVVAIPAAVLVGAVSTYGLAVEGGVTPVVGAGAIGVAAALVAPTRAVPAYCGAFVGMTSPALFDTYVATTAAAGVAAVLFLAARPVYHGVGGKLGTTAFVGVTLTAVATTRPFPTAAIPGREAVLLVVVTAVVAAVVTFSLHVRVGGSAVFASGLVGVVAGAGFPLALGSAGTLPAAAAFGASFAGMSDTGRLPDERWVALAGALVGVVVVYTSPFLAGSGGKLGTIAFGSSLAVHGGLRTTRLVRFRRRLDAARKRDTT